MTFSLVLDGALMFSTILMLGACSGFFSERVGIANISINGQMTFGAMIFTIFAELLFPKLGNESIILPLLLSSVFTVLCSSLFGFLTIKLKTNQIIAGTAINMLVAGLGTFLSEPLGPILSNNTHSILTSSYLPMHELGVNSGFYLSTLLIFIIVVMLVVGLFIIVQYTPFGLRIRAIGNNPNAVDAQGINVIKYQWIAITIGGVLAGLAGGLFMFNKPGTFQGDVSGFGFLALAILIAGSWKIPFIALVSILFAIISKAFESWNSVNKDIAKILPYLITLIGMVAFSKWNVAPKNIGIPFDKTKR